MDLQIPQDFRGLAPERGERAGEAESTVTQKRNERRRGRWQRRPDERNSITRVTMRPRRDGAGRTPNSTVARPMQQIFEA